MVDGQFSGQFFQVDINIRPAEQGCVCGMVGGGDKPPYMYFGVYSCGHLGYLIL